MVTFPPRIMVINVDLTNRVLNKLAGLHSLADGYDILLHRLVKVLEPEFGNPLIVHRLDHDTSSIVFQARTVEAQCSLKVQFQKSRVSKFHNIFLFAESGF